MGTLGNAFAKVRRAGHPSGWSAASYRWQARTADANQGPAPRPEAT
jgi:hypothetical protein